MLNDEYFTFLCRTPRLSRGDLKRVRNPLTGNENMSGDKEDEIQ